MSCSARTLECPYGVTGLKVAHSSMNELPSAAPYKLHEEENRKRPTPARFACSASRTEARWLMS